MRYGPCTFWLIGCVALLAAATPSSAVYYDYSIKLWSPAYWDEYDIALVEVSDVPNAKNVTLKIIEPFDGDHWETSLVSSLADFWYNEDLGDPPPAFKVGQHLLLTRRRGKDIGKVAIVIEGAIDESSLVKSCRTIKKIRSDTDVAHALQLAVASAEPFAEEFILTQLLAAPERGQAAGVLKQLEDLRADAKATMRVRLAASQALNAIRKSNRVESDDWQWAAGVLQGADAKKPFPDLRMVVQRLAEYPVMREKTVDLLAKLADDITLSDAVREAAVDGYANYGMFDAKDPEGLISEKVIATLIRHLQDKVAYVRAYSANSLYRCVIAGPIGGDLLERQLKVAKRVRQALEEAIATEKDGGVRQGLVNSRDGVEETIKRFQGKSQP